jgi:hypothetical protein
MDEFINIIQQDILNNLHLNGDKKYLFKTQIRSCEKKTSKSPFYEKIKNILLNICNVPLAAHWIQNTFSHKLLIFFIFKGVKVIVFI